MDVGLLAGALGGAMLLDWSSVAGASAQTSSRQDVEVLNFLLLVEYVQEAFYRDAVRQRRLQGELLEYATTVAPQEREHVARLRRRLGGDAERPPQFAFGAKTSDPAAFQGAALRLEELGVAGYVGGGPNLSSSAIGEAARIVSVEARQAAWIRNIAGQIPAPRAADPAQDAEAVTKALRDEGFIL